MNGSSGDLKRMIVGLLTLAIITILGGLIINYLLFTPKQRDISLEYIVNISPKEGETPKNLTVYLPFPHHEGEPVERVLETMKELDEKYPKEQAGDIQLVDTKHGKMLKLFFPVLENGWGGNGCAGFDEPYRNNPPPLESKYPLEPRFEVTTNELGEPISHSWIYLDYEGGTGIALASRYWIRDRWKMPISWHVSGRDFWVFPGTDNPPEETVQGRNIGRTGNPVEVEINGNGWIKIPVFGG